MSRFWNLAPTQIHAATVAESQAEADRLFPSAVTASNLTLWKPGDPIPTKGYRILIGIATWSGYDLRLLDLVSQSIKDSNGQQRAVHVFNITGLTAEDLEKYIPGREPIHHTPVVGVWNDGVMMKKSTGHDGRELVAKMFGFNSNEITTFVRQRNSLTAASAASSVKS